MTADEHPAAAAPGAFQAELWSHADAPSPEPLPTSDAAEPLPDELYDLGFAFGFNAEPVEPAWADDEPPPGPETFPPGEDPLLEGLTPEQRDACVHQNGPLLVTAGPGSGKTRVLAHRVAYLVARCGVPAGQILAVTFTNKAAQEMRERIHTLLAKHDPYTAMGRGPRVSTFHSFCASMLRRHGPPERSSQFTIYDDDDRRSLLRRIIKDLELDRATWKPNDLKSRVSAHKNRLETPDDVDQLATTYHDRTFCKVFRAYEQRLRELNALDFDDLLGCFLLRIEGDEDLRSELRARYRYLLVDEYQDTNRPQYRLALALAGPDGNLFVVGDVDQSIYRWRGADIQNLLDFERDHPSAREVRLEQNFRSTQVVCGLAQALIEHNVARREKTLRTDNDPGQPARLHRALTDDDEARVVVDAIESSITGDQDPNEIAIFYRTNALSRQFEQALIHRGIRHRVIGTVPFFARKEVKDVLAFLRILRNPFDEQALARITGVSEGLGAKSYARVVSFSKEHGLSALDALARGAEVPGLRGRPKKAVAKLAGQLQALAALSAGPVLPVIQRVLEQTGYLERLRASEDPQDWSRAENLDALVNAGAEFDERFARGGIGGFLDQAAMLSGTASEDPADGAVRLMTLHAAKGLEFDEVYIVGLDDGLLPLVRESEPGDMEEERRLLYVGITRARKRLTLTTASVRRTYGQTRTSRPSRFLAELPEKLLRRSGIWPKPSSGSRFEPVPAQRSRRRDKPKTWEEEFPLAPPHAEEPAAGDRAEEWPTDEAPDVERRGRRSPRGAARLGSARPKRTPAARRTTPSGLGFAEAARAPKLAPGVRVRHPAFGEGRILSLNGHGVGRRVRVRFEAAGERMLVVQYARLEVLG